MKRALILVLALLATGCGGSKEKPHIVTNYPQPGSYHPFRIRIENNSQWTIQLGVATSYVTGQKGILVVPAGDHVDFYIYFLPSAVSIDAVSFPLPTAVFPTQTQFLYKDYSPYDNVISFSIP